jgi:hypothetical protein
MTRVREKINSYRVFVGKPEGNKQFRGPSCRWEDNIEADLK